MTSRRTMLLASASLAGASNLLACTRDEYRSRIFVAKSLEGAVTAMTAPGGPLEDSQVVAAGSQSVARQVAASRRGEVLVSANFQWIEWLIERGFAPRHAAITLAQNQLVLVGHHASRYRIQAPRDLPNLPFRHLTLGDPRAVPAGQYAKDALTRHHLWDSLHARIETAVNVQAALARAVAHPDELALVYATDAAHEPRVSVLYRFPLEEPKIEYFATPLSCARSKGLAEVLLAGLTSKRAATILKQHGFIATSHPGTVS